MQCYNIHKYISINGRRNIDKIHGNTSGLKASELHDLARLYRRKVPPREVITLELGRTLSEISHAIGRVISLIIDRKGKIEAVFVGDSHEIPFGEILDRARAAKYRLRGYRLIHTHLKSYPLTHPDLATLATERLDLVAALEVRESGMAGRIQLAHILPPNPSGEMWRIEDYADLGRVDIDFEEFIRAIEGEIEKKYFEYGGRSEKEGVFLVGFSTRFKAEAEESLWELQSLVESADKIVLDKTAQMRREADSRYLIGKGKLEEVILKAKQAGAETLIFDTELTPAQVRGITDQTNLRVIDRTQLILQIFAKRATSSEGKIQVELAQLKYMLPRLTGKGAELSQLGGGIGTRGPGEKKLEEQRRTLRKRIETLEKQIEQIGRRREHTRKRRIEAGIPVITLVGYTNVGKSTLFNALTKGAVIAENKLFSTLSPTTRKVRLPGGLESLITDTVGFIRELPKELVNAFRATLEELGKSTILVHVADAGDEAVGERIESVEKILEEAGYGETPRFLVFNKSDVALPEAGARLRRIYNAPLISALDKETLDNFLSRLEAEIERLSPARRDDASADEARPELKTGFEMDNIGG